MPNGLLINVEPGMPRDAVILMLRRTSQALPPEAMIGAFADALLELAALRAKASEA